MSEISQGGLANVVGMEEDFGAPYGDLVKMLLENTNEQDESNG